MLRASIAVRLFLTCWVVYGLHFATNIVREHYPAFALAERGTLRVDPYVGLHPDLFQVDGRGAFINNNPGTSLFAAIPYAVFRPAVDWVSGRVAEARAARGEPVTYEYDTAREADKDFFRRVRMRGLDVRFGLASWVMHAFFMAPLTALSAVVMRSLLLRAGCTAGEALALAFLYAFGTPVFFRTAFINQNLLVTHASLFAFATLYRPERSPADARSLILAGAFLGTAVLCDYAGLVSLFVIGVWAAAERGRVSGPGEAVVGGALLSAGAIVPIALLLGYQAWAFGHPFLPAQHYMPPTELSVVGWNGLTWPKLELMQMNLLDLRFGLFTFAPLLLLAFAAPWVRTARKIDIGGPELALAFGFLAATLLFHGSNEFGRLQRLTGVRYMVPVVPFLFLALVPVVVRLPRSAAVFIGASAIFHSWCLAMVRESVPESLASVLLGGFHLPWLTVLGRMGGQYVSRFAGADPDPLPLLLLAGGFVVALWWPVITRGAGGSTPRTDRTAAQA